MLQPQEYRSNGTGTDQLPTAALPGLNWPRIPAASPPKDFLKALEVDYGVPAELLNRLVESVGRHVARIVDEALVQRKVPLSYFVIRRCLYGTEWISR